MVAACLDSAEWDGKRKAIRWYPASTQSSHAEKGMICFVCTLVATRAKIY